MQTVRKNVDRCRQGMRTQMGTQEHEQTINVPPEAVLVWRTLCNHDGLTNFIRASGHTLIGGFLAVVVWRRGDARINLQTLQTTVDKRSQ